MNFSFFFKVNFNSKKYNSFPPTSMVNCKLESIEFKNIKNDSRFSKGPVHNAGYLNWLKEFIFWSSPVKGTRVEDNGNWRFQNHTRRFFFFLSQTLESSLGYKYWISYLKLTPLLEGQVHLLFWRLQLTSLEYFWWWLHMSLFFSSIMLKSLNSHSV